MEAAWKVEGEGYKHTSSMNAMACLSQSSKLYSGGTECQSFVPLEITTTLQPHSYFSVL